MSYKRLSDELSRRVDMQEKIIIGLRGNKRNVAKIFKEHAEELEREEQEAEEEAEEEEDVRPEELEEDNPAMEALRRYKENGNKG